MKKTAKQPVKRRDANKRAVGFIGAGNMATAMIKGLIDMGLYGPELIVASDVDAKQRNRIKRRFNVAVAGQYDAVERVTVACRETTTMDEVLAGLRSSHLTTFISIAAGITTTRIEAGLGVRARVLRCPPHPRCSERACLFWSADSTPQPPTKSSG
jgi:pyrroline-5-carboxylate reductase